MNKSIIMGRLVADPQVRYTESGKCVCQFVVAVDRPYTNANGKREADFIPVVVWDKAAEVAGNSLAKGHRVLVEGRLQIRSYEAKDGTKKWISEIISNNFEFIERKADVQNKAQEQPKSMQDMGKDVPFDEEVPF